MATGNMPRIYYKGQKYTVGGQTGYRPAAAGSVQVIKDLAFMSEVVERKRLSMSADELLHGLKMVLEVGPELVSEDGMPRGITGMVKFNRTFKGKLAAANAGWNETCHCYIKPQLFSGVTREITAAEFRNTNAAVACKVTNVIYDGATAGTNVIKGGKNIIALGTNMKFVTEGDDADLAKLIVPGTATPYTLTCTQSDAGKMVFAWPAGLTVQNGDQVVLYIRSHAGIDGNDDSVNEKTVLCLAADPVSMTVSKIHSEHGDNILYAGHEFTVHGSNFVNGSRIDIVFRSNDGDVIQRTLKSNANPTAGVFTVTGTEFPSIAIIDNTKPISIVVVGPGTTGQASSPNCQYTEVAP